MKKYFIHGGRPLYGKVEISGAKNAAVGIIPAALLVNGVCRIGNLPQISDVTLMLNILQELGANVRTINRSTVEVDCTAIHNSPVAYESGRKIRASYYLLGALLGRFGQAEVPLPGGCDFGGRPIDQHLKGLRALGADVEVKNGFMCAKVPDGRLKGSHIYLDVVTVGATMNVMLAATLADGLTVIENAAKEPHIVDLANFLNSMGAQITGAGTDVIKVRGVDIRDVPLSELMDKISMVFQHVYLFADTVYNNIAMGRPTATREEVEEAAKKARCYDFIMNLPQGFDTVIGEGGASLSGGEKQRISIARCILKDAPIVILDEATASVDLDNERYIQEAITELVRGKTLLVIAHRLNTIRAADKIVVVSEGKIAEQGTHEQLLKRGGIYNNFIHLRERQRLAENG